jgi:LPXTG-motif cell wall-anchored protein
MTRVWARMILLVCLVLTLVPASAVGATGALSLNKPPWLVKTSEPTSSGSGTLPHTGDDLPQLALAGLVLIAAGSLLRVRASRAHH